MSKGRTCNILETAKDIKLKLSGNVEEDIEQNWKTLPISGLSNERICNISSMAGYTWGLRDPVETLRKCSTGRPNRF